jgi:hypothetical protein
VTINIIFLLLWVILLMGDALIRVENERRLLWYGRCLGPASLNPLNYPTWEDQRAAQRQAYNCLATQRTRTSKWADLMAALNIPGFY